MKPIFSQQQSLATRFVLLTLLSLGLLFVDHSFNYLSVVRNWMTAAATPVQFLADIPSRVWGVADEIVTSRSDLMEDNARLKAKTLILEQKVQKLASLTAQNIRLRELLNSSELVDEQVLVAEIVGVDPDPFRHIVTINKGSLNDVFEGQAIVDAHGVMGQVIEVTPLSSRVVLVTDNSSRIPVQVNRTGYRAVAAGTGLPDSMELMHIPDTADIREGDLLTSSGLGQRYPAGYPLGKVRKVTHNPGDAFASVEIQLLAEVNRSRFVLLVFRTPHESIPGQSVEEAPEENTGQTTGEQQGEGS
ncbi:rod shape-determining protein MreC [Endozoicomonas gorgoniicola]|uniref:rod shape-determining protein MreC n=1 Tax=Endozoicomonas gorgoniicola TaxID=1234144 RepID=UPI002AD2147C|nr:rod shape-determining protein MreC [Endozoicomonas gorgoniicola]